MIKNCINEVKLSTEWKKSKQTKDRSRQFIYEKKHTTSVLNFTDKIMNEIDKIPAKEIEYCTEILKKAKDFKQERYQETLK